MFYIGSEFLRVIERTRVAAAGRQAVEEAVRVALLDVEMSTPG